MARSKKGEAIGPVAQPILRNWIWAHQFPLSAQEVLRQRPRHGPVPVGHQGCLVPRRLERCESLELPLRRSALHNAVSVAAMQHQLGAGPLAYKQLPHAHQVALLSVRDPKKIEKLATRALSKKLSVRSLKEEVAEERASATEGPKRGRPPDPALLKAINRTLAALVVDGKLRAVTKAQVDELSADQKAAVLRTAQQIQAHLEGLIAKLE